MSFNIKDFWDNKILEWECGRYNLNTSKNKPLEMIADLVSKSLRFRLKITKELLKPHIKGKAIIEIGCGSGLLTKFLHDNGAKYYQGFDISENAISQAIKIANQNKIKNFAKYQVCTVSNLPKLNGDIVFSLGLLDWLNDYELDILFKSTENKKYFHAIAEKSLHPSQLIHRLYVYLSYGYKTKGYKPRYYNVEKLQKMITKYNNNDKINVYRNKKLSFGALISNLSIPKV